MKTLSAALVTALLVFALATAWMEVVQPRLDALARAATPKGKEGEAKAAGRRIYVQTDSDEADSADDSTVIVSKKSKKSSKSRSDDALTEATKKRLLAQFDEVKRKEDKLIEREDTIKTICDDIRRELVEIEQIRRQSAANVAFAERTILESASNPANATRQANVPQTPTRVSASSRAKSEARIAGVVRDLASKGNFKDAAALLSGLKDRDVARILGSLTATNPTIALRLSDQVQSARMQAARSTNTEIQ